MFEKSENIRVFLVFAFRSIFFHAITELHFVNAVNRWSFTFNMKVTAPTLKYVAQLALN